MTPMSASTITEVLAPIWERVLHRPAIHVEDNFFDLGGDSLLAVELFTEIARVCGRELAPVTIYCAPTIASLAAVLEEPTAPRFPPLLQLKSGTQAPPVFLAHGLGGTAMDFFQLVKHIRTECPIYGIQAKGTDGVDEPFDCIEDLAQFQLDAIRELQPHGPYCFDWLLFGRAGYPGDGPAPDCLGGKGRAAGYAGELPPPAVSLAKAARAPRCSIGHSARHDGQAVADTRRAFLHHSSLRTPIVCFSGRQRDRAKSITGRCLPYPGHAARS